MKDGNAEGEPFMSFRWGVADWAIRKMEKKRALSERSEFRPFPIFCIEQSGTPKGQRLAVAFFCLLFLAKQEK